MAIVNRSTHKTNIDALIDRNAPYDGNPLIQKLEDQEIRDEGADSVVFRTPDISAINGPSTAVALDFDLIDRYDIDATTSTDVDFVITVSNILSNETGVIGVTKRVDQKVTFANATVIPTEITDSQIGKTFIAFFVRNSNDVFVAQAGYKITTTTSDLADGSVTEPKIGSSAVTSNKIGTSAVTSSKIGASAVTTSKIADQDVTTAKIDDGAVTSAKLASNSVSEINIIDGAVTTDKIANGDVTTDKISNGDVTTAKIDNEAVTNDKLADGAVDQSKIEANQVLFTNTGGLGFAQVVREYINFTWDMDSVSARSIGIYDDYSGILTKPTVLIRPDTATDRLRNLEEGGTMLVNIESTGTVRLSLSRTIDGVFDNSNYNSSTSARGVIVFDRLA